MAKKNRKPKAKQRTENQRAENPEIDAKILQESVAEASKKVNVLSRLPLPQQKAHIRQLLIEIGTNVSINDNDPTGDGDQNPIASLPQRDVARHLFSSGGDVEQHLAKQALSKFALGCAVGSLKAVGDMVKDAVKVEARPYSRSEKMLTLLETRETSLRLSPLLLIVSAGKNIIGERQDFQGVSKLLLKYGASPVAKDVFGKTVCHYGAGAMATKMTLDVVDMCIHAAKTHHMFGKEIQLHSLNTQEMNGKVGIVGGFDSDTGRRSVFLQDDQREVWIKTENMSLTRSNNESPSYPLLTDVQDRLGSVSLHEVCLPRQFSCGTERVDVAEFLLEKHHTCIHTKEMDGVSPFQMTSGMGQMIGATGVAKLIMESATREARETTKVKRQNKLCCANCKKGLDRDAPSCSRCNISRYCGRECQVSHWKDHKKECKDLASLSLGVKLDPPNKMKMNLPGGRSHFGMSYKTGTRNSDGIKYRKPCNVEHDKKFVVKVQASRDDNFGSIYIYDQSRTCEFFINSGQSGFQDILTEIRNEPAWQGQKTFMKASFDRSGTCTVYPETTGVKLHYTW
ncbi:hypothetical protein ACHAXR_011342 [Thalassiosira sp. AJA248-18]